jgi:NDP-sugar pyrophosphorylase family protein
VINIVVPMAGHGSRFASSPDTDPKPLIEVVPGKRMIEYVIDYLTLPEPHRFIFVCREEHAGAFGLASLFRDRTIAYDLILTERVTRGPAETALLAEPLIDNDTELLIAYSDGFLTVDVGDVLHWARTRNADGAVITYPSSDPTYSYADIDGDGRVLRTMEKVVISPHATAGFYYFRRGGDYVAAAKAMIAAEATGVEPFVAPTYNELIRSGKTVLSYPIRCDQKIEMGTPKDLADARLWLDRGRPIPTVGRA